MAYRIRFSDAAGERLASLTARDRANTSRQDRAPAHPSTDREDTEPQADGPGQEDAHCCLGAAGVGDLRVYYAVEEKPEPVVVIVAVGIKVRERITIGGKDIKP